MIVARSAFFRNSEPAELDNGRPSQFCHKVFEGTVELEAKTGDFKVWQLLAQEAMSVDSWIQTDTWF